MDTALGLAGMVGFIAAMLVVSAGVTWAVVRVDSLIRKKKT